jgi:molybdopterin/thiamine biosynthesis adenylyltransferase
MDQEVYKKQIEFFGIKGQEILQELNVAIVGVGGTGSHVCQQLAFLGVGNISIIDDDKLEKTNRNRLIGLHWEDPIGMLKVDIAERNIRTINPQIKVRKIPFPLISTDGFDAVKNADYAFGCVDNDGARLVLNELCLAYEIPFFDVASEIITESSEYGGHVVSVVDGQACLFCLDLINSVEANKHLQNAEARKDWKAIYGIEKNVLGDTGPSVVSINGIMASMVVTEFMLRATGIRDSKRFLIYRGSRGIVAENKDSPNADCYYCKCIRGKSEKSDVDRYLNS